MGSSQKNKFKPSLNLNQKKLKKRENKTEFGNNKMYRIMNRLARPAAAAMKLSQGQRVFSSQPGVGLPGVNSQGNIKPSFLGYTFWGPLGACSLVALNSYWGKTCELPKELSNAK